jgi:ubiquinone/menaquinone biosynthesis C-methylase UbiE
MKKNDFAELSYTHHEKHYEEYQLGDEKIRRARSWQRSDTVDAWCRQRLIGAIDPILRALPHAHWLTVGDGRYGSDAHYIESKGSAALATDISDVLLEQAVKEGYIKDGRKENAEALSFAPNEFEFVLCKDSLHHFPRPPLAIYEMLWVAKTGIVLIEPNDGFIFSGLTEHLYLVLKDLFFKFFLQRKTKRNQYEEVGNYIYGISKREIEKMALALNYEVIAFRSINTYYIDGIEDENLDERGPLFRRVRFMIGWRDLLSRLHLKPAGVLAAIILKISAGASLEKELLAAGYKVIRLPRNPYLNTGGIGEPN